MKKIYIAEINQKLKKIVYYRRQLGEEWKEEEMETGQQD